MVERGPPRETNKSFESILAQASVETILSAAKENLIKGGALVPALFLHFAGGEKGILTVTALPDTTEGKEAYFTALGLSLRQAGHPIHEALFVSETWYVVAEKGERLPLDVAQRHHPKRKEAITLVGRNAERRGDGYPA